MMKLYFNCFSIPTLFVLFICLWLTTAEKTVAANDINSHTRPKIGLVLSGGGARGAAHIGVIEVLEKLGVPVDYIAGTSMGSIVGGLYASGMSTDEITQVLVSIDWSSAFIDKISREDRSFRRKKDDDLYLIKSRPGLSDSGELKLPVGILQGQEIDLIFKRHTVNVAGIDNFDNLKIPYRAVATDIVTGQTVVIDSGDLASAMRASMSIPPIFSPVERDGKLLVDGGVSNNLPIDVARNMGADVVIVVDISTPLLKKEQLTSTLSITGQLTGILTRRNTEEQLTTLRDGDVLIIPELGDITSGSFDRAGEAIPLGVTAAERQHAKLMQYAIVRKSDPEILSPKPDRTITAPLISFIDINNQSQISDEVLRARLNIEIGKPLDIEKLQKNIDRIYGLELFENVNYEIIDKDDKSGIRINAKERAWGPNYLQTGLALSENFDGDNSFSLGFAYTRTAINRLGGEWRTAFQIGESPSVATELYQPLDYDSRYFIHPILLYQKRNINLYEGGREAQSQYKYNQYGINIALGREIDTWGEMRLGLKRLKGETELRGGLGTLDDTTFDVGEWYAQFSVDNLNNRYFPTKGMLGSLTYQNSLEELGADSSFEQILFNIVGAKTWGRNTVMGGVRYLTTLGDDAPLQSQFFGGGLFNFSGYNINELNGQHLGLLRLGYLRRVGNFNLMPLYTGGSLELGNVWQDRDDIALDNTNFGGSVYVGVDTLIGPLYLAYGIAEDDNQSFYFLLGKLF